MQELHKLVHIRAHGTICNGHVKLNAIFWYTGIFSPVVMNDSAKVTNTNVVIAPIPYVCLLIIIVIIKTL